jgi:YHS domain-containing protein
MTLVQTLVISLLLLGGPKPPVNTQHENLALRGYDAVAYFTDGKSIPGMAAFETVWNGARWRFASAAHRDAFVKDPQKYAPQFGGYCAWAVGHNYTADGDPEAWKIVDGKLYVNYSKRVQKKWEAGIDEYIRQGHANWPAVLDK